MSKRHMVTKHYIITVYNAMIDDMNGVMQALDKNKTRWNEVLYFAVKFAHQKLSNNYAAATPVRGYPQAAIMVLVYLHMNTYHGVLQV